MTEAEAIAIIRELRHYGDRLEYLREQATETLHAADDGLTLWESATIEASLGLAVMAIGQAAGAITAAHCLDDEAEEPKELRS